MCALAVLLCLCVLVELPHPAVAQVDEAEAALSAARGAFEQARFDEAKAKAKQLLERTDLPPRTRNAALELAAIIDIAARNEVAAQVTLAQLYARDPDHPRRVPDPGPAVEVAFARARPRTPAPEPTRFTADPKLDAQGRLQLRVHLLEGADAVESVHVLTWLPQLSEPVEVVAHPNLRDQITLTLPTPEPDTRTLPVVIEARAPSGYVLARAGTVGAPKQAVVPVPAVDARARGEGPPLRRAWWLWTSVSIVVAGIAVGAGVAAH